MGTLRYGSPDTEIEFDDRSLAHLQLVIVAKLRRRESFLFSWAVPPAMGSGRRAIWIDPSNPLEFRYEGSRLPIINKAWVDALMLSANSPGGLAFSAEPDESE